MPQPLRPNREVCDLEMQSAMLDANSHGGCKNPSLQGLRVFMAGSQEQQYTSKLIATRARKLGHTCTKASSKISLPPLQEPLQVCVCVVSLLDARAEIWEGDLHFGGHIHVCLRCKSGFKADSC